MSARAQFSIMTSDRGMISRAWARPASALRSKTTLRLLWLAVKSRSRVIWEGLQRQMLPKIRPNVNTLESHFLGLPAAGPGFFGHLSGKYAEPKGRLLPVAATSPASHTWRQAAGVLSSAPAPGPRGQSGKQVCTVCVIDTTRQAMIDSVVNVMVGQRPGVAQRSGTSSSRRLRPGKVCLEPDR